MSDHAAAYGPDILIALVSTATFGGWGLAGAAVFSLARHSPVVREGVAQLAPQLEDARRRLPELLTATPHDRALARRDAPRTPADAPRAPRPPGPRLLSPGEFARDPLFQALDADPHRFIIGHTQGGKSTAMHAMAGAWAARGEPVIVCDPDAARGQWPGCEVAGYAEDYHGIGQALERVEVAFEERSLLYADGQRDFAPLHLVIDEVHEVFDNVPGARELVLDTLGRRGAKRGIRVTIGTQDQNKDTLGLDSAAVLSNFITAELAKDERGRRVATVYRGNAGKRQHVKQYALPPLPGAKTFIKAKEEPAPPRRAAVAADAPRAETVSVRVPARPAADLSGLLASLLAELPADVAAQVPDISPERAARLAKILESSQRVTVGRDGGDVHVHVQQVSAPAPVAARSRRGRGGVDTRKMRERADKYRAVKAVIAEGGSANEAQRRAQLGREKALAYARRARAELGGSE